MKLEDNDLVTVSGGAFKFGVVAAVIVGVGAFLIGVLDGQIKLKWQKLKNTVFKGNFVEKPSIQIHQEDAIMYIKL